MFNEEVWEIINSSKCSAARNKNETIIRDGVDFHPLPLYAQDEINSLVSADEKSKAMKIGAIRTVADVAKDYEASIKPKVMAVAKKVNDFCVSQRANSVSGGFDNGGKYNVMTGVGARGFDPATSWRPNQRLWLTPYDASAIYSQGGFAEIVINKKSDSVLLNGVKITNPYLGPKDLQKVNEKAKFVHSIDHVVAEAIKWSLVFGGSIVFPFFKTDNPVSIASDVRLLLKSGVLKKDCIDRFCVLDRWNVVHVPQWNPTQADFQNPKKYFIPFLGSDLHGSRVSRIVTSPQPGYVGIMQTSGWGLSDMVSWYESLYNYEGVMAIIPTMINQMSIIARTINVDGIMAGDGAFILDSISENNQDMVRRHTGLDDPITLDVIGNLQSIDRDFSEVYQLVRLLRQDWCGKAKIPEEMILSADKASFTGDNSDGVNEKMWENVKYVHKLVAKSVLNLAYFLIIDTLGTDVVGKIKYTNVEFDNPAVADGRKRAQLFKDLSSAVFNLASATVPSDLAIKMMGEVSQTDLEVDEEIIKELAARQKKIDEQNDKRFENEMKMAKSQGQEQGGGVNGKSPSERLEHNKGNKVSENTQGGNKQQSLGMRMTGRAK